MPGIDRRTCKSTQRIQTGRLTEAGDIKISICCPDYTAVSLVSTYIMAMFGNSETIHLISNSYLFQVSMEYLEKKAGKKTLNNLRDTL